MLKLTSLLALLLFIAAPASAQLGFATTTHDFGAIDEGETVAYTFVLTNRGGEPLTLRSVRPSCGCTTPSFTTEPIEPGGAGEIVVEFNSQGRPGPFRKSIGVTAMAGEKAVNETLYITGDVKQPGLSEGVAQGSLLFDTDAHDFGPVALDQQVSHVFKVQHTGTRPVRITEAKTYPDGLHVVFPDGPIFADDLVDVRVTVPAGAADGDFDYAIVLQTDDEDQPSKSLRLTGTMR